MLLKGNLQLFAGDVDLDSLRNEFLSSYQEETPEPEVEELVETPETEFPEESEDLSEPEDDNEFEEPEDEEEPEELDRDQLPTFEQPKKKQSKEDNAAFAELRRQNQELQRQAKIAEQVAAQYGMTVEQFEQAYAEQQLQQRAQQQNLPVDVLKRLEAAESQLAEQTQSAEREKFWNSVDRVKERYGLQDNEVNNVFNYLGQSGLVNSATGLPLIDFEQAYKLANFDSIQERREKESHQKRLEAKKQRQAKSALPTTTNASAASNQNDDEWSLDAVEKRLRERNLI